MANLVIVVTDTSNGQLIAGAFVTVQLVGNSSWGSAVPNPGKSGVTDNNGQYLVELPQAPNGWAGDCWKYSGKGSVQANGYATTPFDVSTGCITGDVTQAVPLNRAISTSGGTSSAGSAASSGQVALTAPAIDWASYAPYIIGGVVGLVILALVIYYRRPIARALKSGASKVKEGAENAAGKAKTAFMAGAL